MSRAAAIKQEVLSRFKRGELRRSTGALVTTRAEAIRIALDLAERDSSAPAQRQLTLIDPGPPAEGHQLLYQGNLGAHATEAVYVCRLCRVTVAEVGRGSRKRQFWGEARELVPPRCRPVVP